MGNSGQLNGREEQQPAMKNLNDWEPLDIFLWNVILFRSDQSSSINEDYYFNDMYFKNSFSF